MGWQTDRGPVEYLERRAIYYKKKVGSVRILLNNVDDHQALIVKYGGRDTLINHLKDCIIHFSGRVEEYENAATILKQAIE